MLKSIPCLAAVDSVMFANPQSKVKPFLTDDGYFLHVCGFTQTGSLDGAVSLDPLAVGELDPLGDDAGRLPR